MRPWISLCVLALALLALSGVVGSRRQEPSNAVQDLTTLGKGDRSSPSPAILPPSPPARVQFGADELGAADQDVPEGADTVLRGLVVEAETALPVPGAHVFLTRAGAPYIDSDSAVATGSDGAFELSVRASNAAADAVVSAQADGYEPESLLVRLPLEVGGLMRIALSTGARIAGRVCDLKGRGIEGVEVLAARPWNHAATPWEATLMASKESLGGTVQTDAAGEFVLRGLTAGVDYEVYARAPGWGRPPFSHVRVRTPAEIEIVLQRTAVLTFHFIDDLTGHGLPRPLEVLAIPSPGLTPTAGQSVAGGLSGPAFRYLVSQTVGIGNDLFVRFSTRSAVYARVQGTVQVTPGEAIVHEVRCRRASREPLVDLGWNAAYPSGKPFSGVLSVMLESADAGGADVVPLRFEGGELVRGVTLPSGNFRATVFAGRDAETGFWRAIGGAVALHVGRDGRAHPALVVRGAPCMLRVMRHDGQEARGCLVKAIGGEEAPPDDGWRRSRAPGTQAIWLAPGPWRLIAGLPEWGAGSCDVEIGENGDPVEATLLLDPANELDPWLGRQRVLNR